jgi:serine-type D-Ala-D-Ala carboxypeptidase (penicillin-binding protein 5/6)
VKTGYTGKAGRCFVGAANRESMQLISVVMNSGSIFDESAKLMDAAFAQYDMIPVAEPRLALGAVKSVEGINGAVRYGSSQKLVLPLSSEEQERLYLDIGVATKLEAPVADGQPVGIGRVMLDGKELGTFPVVSLEADGRRTFKWYLKKVVEGFVWRMDREESGYRSIWPLAD